MGLFCLPHVILSPVMYAVSSHTNSSDLCVAGCTLSPLFIYMFSIKQVEINGLDLSHSNVAFFSLYQTSNTATEWAWFRAAEPSGSVAFHSFICKILASQQFLIELRCALVVQHCETRASHCMCASPFKYVWVVYFGHIRQLHKSALLFRNKCSFTFFSGLIFPSTKVFNVIKYPLCC